jgi:hypothetical protein
VACHRWFASGRRGAEAELIINKITFRIIRIMEPDSTTGLGQNVAEPLGIQLMVNVGAVLFLLRVQEH